MTTQTQQDVCCLKGMPVAGNPTQYMLEKAFDAGRVDWRFLTFEVSPRDFEGAMRGARIFGFRGILLAPPHRATVLPYLDELSKTARLSGQVNCISQVGGRLHGANTEGMAMRQLLKPVLPVADTRVTILGGGRLAHSIAAELAIAGASKLTLISRQADEAKPLIARLLDQTLLSNCQLVAWPQEEPLAIEPECQLLVNATPVGCHDPDQSLPIVLESLSENVVVADVVYNPPGTWLINHAAERGCKTIDGLSLYIERTAQAFETWTVADADRQIMREAVEEFLVI